MSDNGLYCPGGHCKRKFKCAIFTSNNFVGSKWMLKEPPCSPMGLTCPFFVDNGKSE